MHLNVRIASSVSKAVALAACLFLLLLAVSESPAMANKAGELPCDKSASSLLSNAAGLSSDRCNKPPWWVKKWNDCAKPRSGRLLLVSKNPAVSCATAKKLIKAKKRWAPQKGAPKAIAPGTKRHFNSGLKPWRGYGDGSLNNDFVNPRTKGRVLDRYEPEITCWTPKVN